MVSFAFGITPRMSSAAAVVFERSEPGSFDRSCSILLLDNFFLLWSFLKKLQGIKSDNSDDPRH